ncbi:prolipoprotein diacylglyceryl transferase [Oscillospiraceae bacterium MB08-C2-2]|nr:prolipoprotein diacylglyceryl transferase [Oscillospiraceae bacterium MB08-C2-2]
MTDTLYFPKLGLEFELNRVAFSVGSVAIYWYGIILTTAFLLGALYALRRARSFGLDPDRVIDLIMGGTILGIVGARVYYVAFKWEEFQDNLINIFNTRLGGLAIYGGIIGAFLACLFLGKWRKVKLLPALDLAAGGLLLGQAVGRWGNFVNMEAFGSNTNAPWGMTSQTIASFLQLHKAQLQSLGVAVDPAVPVHPTFLYESLWCLAGFALIVCYTNRRRFDGELSLLYLAWYGAGRMLIEGLRTDSLLMGYIRISQLLAALCVVASLILLVALRSRIKREADSQYMMLHVSTPLGQHILHGLSTEQAEKLLNEENEAETSDAEASSDEEENEEENVEENEAGDASPSEEEVPHEDEDPSDEKEEI